MATAAQDHPSGPLSGRVLVTGTAFVGASELDLLRATGLVTETLATVENDAELQNALQGKRAYLWGAMERVTPAALAEAKELEAIGFPGSGYAEFIPAWSEATHKGIAIVTAVGMNAPAVAEYALSLMLAMLRHIPEQVASGALPSTPVHELPGLTLGVIGFGHTGQRMAKMAGALGMKVLVCTRSTTMTPDTDHIESVPLETLLEAADIISVHVSRINGRHVLGSAELAKVRDGTIVINVAFPDAIAWAPLREAVLAGRLRAAYDAPPDGVHSDLPSDRFFCSIRQTAFNTVEANSRAGAHITRAVIEVLTTGASKAVVNPEFAQFRSSDPR